MEGREEGRKKERTRKREREKEREKQREKERKEGRREGREGGREGGREKYFGSTINRICYWIQLRVRVRQTIIKDDAQFPSWGKLMNAEEKRGGSLFF